MSKEFIHTILAVTFTAILFFTFGYSEGANKAEKKLKESAKLTKKAQERSIKALQIAKYYKERCENDKKDIPLHYRYAKSNSNDHQPISIK